MLLKRSVPGKPSRIQIPFENHAAAWTATEIPILTNAFEFLQVCQWWKALLAIHSEFIYWLLKSRVLWGAVSVLHNWKGEIQCATKMGFDFLLSVYIYLFAKLTKWDMFAARLGISAIQMLDVFLRHWGRLVSKQLSCPILTLVFGHFYRHWNVTAGLMQLLYLLRLVGFHFRIFLRWPRLAKLTN